MFSKLYLEISAQAPPLVRETCGSASPPPPRRVREDIVKSIWMEQPWGKNHIRDVKGRRVEIISPGWLNGSSGPDFKNAIFRMDGGKTEKGDVEIHVRSSDWNAHKHHLDNRYDNTRLHVVLYCDLGSAARLTSKAAPLIELELAPLCANAIDRIRSELPCPPESMDAAQITGRCGASFVKIGGEKASQLLDAAGEGRCELKSRRYLDAMRQERGKEELYNGIFQAMGLSSFKHQFGVLASAVTQETAKCILLDVTARKRAGVMTAALLGAAGLLPDPSMLDGKLDNESKTFLETMWNFWSETSGKYGLKPALAKEDWRLYGTRPANFPQGRIVALANFLASHAEGDLESLFARAIDKFPFGAPKKKISETMDDYAKLFPSPEGDYFARRYVIGGKPLANVRRLVGPERAGILFINVIIPYMLARARKNTNTALEERIRLIYHSIPSGERNSITTFMAERLDSLNTPGFFGRTPRQQGLIQIYTDFCAANERGCEDCRFASYLEKLAGE